jgi:transcriptional regulator with XRE-family HTH domain
LALLGGRHGWEPYRSPLPVLSARSGGNPILGVEVSTMAETSGSVDTALPFSREVGVRLRAVRRQRRLSLDDVERSSGGRWSASAIGAYERGFRNLSLPRLRELAEFFDVPMSMLLGEIDLRDGVTNGADDRTASGKVVLDLVALEQIEAAAPVLRYARSIVLDRGDWNGRVLSVRRDDVRALCSMLHTTESDLMAQLNEWKAVLPTANPLTADDASAR